MPPEQAPALPGYREPVRRQDSRIATKKAVDFVSPDFTIEGARERDPATVEDLNRVRYPSGAHVET
jgi:hypothetical protein